MSALTKVTINCATDPQIDSRLKEIASEIKRLIDAGNAVEAEPLIIEAKRLIEQQKSARVQTVPLTAADIAQRDLDSAAATAAAGKQLVAARDELLRACDWTQIPDAVLPAGTTGEQWRSYRQQLRDWTEKLDDPNAPPPWPARPGV